MDFVKFRFPFEGNEFLLDTKNDHRYQWDEDRQEIYDIVTQSNAIWSSPTKIATSAMFALNL